jgi:hypothetical protein
MYAKAALIGLASNFATAWAVQIIPTAQDRFVTATIAPDSQSFAAPDFSPFDAVAFLQRPTQEARAEQTSTIDPFAIDVDMLGYSVNGGTGHSKLDLEFSLSADTPYQLVGRYGKHGPVLSPDSTLIIRLTGPSGNVVDFTIINSNPDGFIPIDITGTLAAGNYTLLVDAQARNTFGGFTDVFADFRLSVPETWTPGDLDHDGDVDLADLSQLLAHFGMSGPTEAEGDIDGDGDVDIADLAILLANFGT